MCVGTDSDKDGLSDVAEKAFGTDPKKADSDSDGYNDFTEITRGYNPMGDDKLVSDSSVGCLWSGLFVKTSWTQYLWYIEPKQCSRVMIYTPSDLKRVTDKYAVKQ